jgi:hypothetical protein
LRAFDAERGADGFEAAKGSVLESRQVP